MIHSQMKQMTDFDNFLTKFFLFKKRKKMMEVLEDALFNKLVTISLTSEIIH